MPNVKGVVLTDRDRVLLSYVGVARYASADQVHKLLFDGRTTAAAALSRFAPVSVRS